MTEHDLLAAVDALTKPTVEHFTQTDDDGGYLKTHSTEHPPLLQQLGDAVNPSSNKSAGSASLASTRNLINSDALFEYSKMTVAVATWCRWVNVTPTRNPVKDLRAWYVAFNATDTEPDWYRTELRRWAHLIRALIDPPKRFEVAVTCPVCRNDHWENPDGEMMPWPILVEYTLSEDGATPRNVKAACRALECDAQWDSLEAVNELGEELAEYATPNA